MSAIRCRAQVTDACYQLRGVPAEAVYEDGVREDSTWRPSDDTVVCTPCYVAVGAPLLPELEDAVRAKQEQLASA
jgi:hypothetical protein